MKVFISYSREDETIAHLLAFCLDKLGIKCLVDRETIRTGENVNHGVLDMIQSADIVLLLLSKRSVASPWVNQEIGFSIASGKEIWPIAFSHEVDLKDIGMISTFNRFIMFDWSRPKENIEALARSINESSQSPTIYDRHLSLKLDQAIQGRVERAEFLSSRYQALLEKLKGSVTEITILKQAAFSIFSISDDPIFRDDPDHPHHYLSLLLNQKKLLEELLENPRVKLKLILWPKAAHSKEYLTKRYHNLIRWLQVNGSKRNVEFCHAQFPGPNRTIVPGYFCIEGFKQHQNPGYQVSVVKYRQDKIDTALLDFHSVFSTAKAQGSAGDATIRFIESQLEGTQK